MSSTPQTPWFAALEVAAVAGRAAEVDREPRVALVHEVLRVAVPVVAVGVGRAAVRVDDRGHRAAPADASRGRIRNAGDLEAVERLERHVLERGVRARSRIDRGAGAWMARGAPPGATRRSSGGVAWSS